jgi:AbrB family looped-hinge helix DNA binding protein
MKHKLATAKLFGRLGRVVIPEQIRDALGLKPGTPVIIYIEKGKVIIEKYTPEKE